MTTATLGWDDTLAGLARIWDITSPRNEILVKRLLLQGMDEFDVIPSDWFARLSKGPAIDDVEARWLKEEGYPRDLTVTLSGGVATTTGNLFGTAATLANLKNVLRVDSCLWMELSGTQTYCKVTAVDAGNSGNPVFSVTALNGTSLPTQDGTTPYTFRVVQEPYTDNRAADNPRFLDRSYDYVTTEIFSDTVQIEKTRKNIRMANGLSEVEHQIKKVIERLRDKKALACIYSKPIVDGNGVAQSLMGASMSKLCGLIWWAEHLYGSGKEYENANVLKDLGGNPMDVDDIDLMALHMVMDLNTDFNKGDWQFWCNPVARWYLHQSGQFMRREGRDDKGAGYGVDEIFLKSTGKTITVHQDVAFPKTWGFLMNMDNFKYGNFVNDDLNRYKLPSQTGRLEAWQLTFQLYGLVVRNVKNAMGVLKNAAVVM